MDSATRPFRFLALVLDSVSARQLANDAHRAESMGYAGLVFADHLMSLPAPVPMIAAVAASTERLRLSTFVLNNDFRHPALVAQDLATLDVLSEGRLDIGMGAGFSRPEYDAAGIPFESVAIRVARLEESIAILKGLFAPGPFNFTGTHYAIKEMDSQPKPVQRPHPPFLIGGGGRRLLTLAAREANTVALAARFLPSGHQDPRSITTAATKQKLEWIRESAGDRFDQLNFCVHPQVTSVVVTDRPRSVVLQLAERLRKETGVDISADDLLESPHIFIGSVDSLVEKFQTIRSELGISSIVLGKIDDLSPVIERLSGT